MSPMTWIVSTDEPPDINKAFAVLLSPVTVKLPSDLIARFASAFGCLSIGLCVAAFDVTFKKASYDGDAVGFPI